MESKQYIYVTNNEIFFNRSSATERAKELDQFEIIKYDCKTFDKIDSYIQCENRSEDAREAVHLGDSPSYEYLNSIENKEWIEQDHDADYIDYLLQD
jgi:hypothetical protein